MPPTAAVTDHRSDDHRVCRLTAAGRHGSGVRYGCGGGAAERVQLDLVPDEVRPNLAWGVDRKVQLYNDTYRR